jgi:hypothetical protein
VFLIIGVILLVLWLFGVLAFRMTKGVIHLALIIAVIAIAVHFLRGAHMPGAR